MIHSSAPHSYKATYILAKMQYWKCRHLFILTSDCYLLLLLLEVVRMSILAYQQHQGNISCKLINLFATELKHMLVIYFAIANMPCTQISTQSLPQ
jgi:hypothetical protein